MFQIIWFRKDYSWKGSKFLTLEKGRDLVKEWLELEPDRRYQIIDLETNQEISLISLLAFRGGCPFLLEMERKNNLDSNEELKPPACK